MAPRSEPELELVLGKKEMVADGVVRLLLHHPRGGALPMWEPGAHLDLVLGDDVVRQYSLCGDPDDRSALQLAVLREEASRGGSQHVHDRLTEGDIVRVRGPRNHFPLVRADRYLFIAGGIGITPLLPMIARVNAAGADWRLVYGGRRRASMAFHTELEERYPGRVTVHPQDEADLLDLPALLTGPDLTVYCCGPEGLLAAVEERCATWPPGALRVERFRPREGAPDAPREEFEFEVELARAGTTLTVPVDRSLLDAIEESGVQVLSSCREGTCGTCETTVLAGIPEHRDSILNDEEKAANDAMMICVSRSRSPRLVLDL